MSLLSIKHLEKYLKLEEVLREHLIMMLWVLKLDLSTVLKDRFKKENKSFILLLFTKSMSSTQDLKDFWLFFQEPLVRSLKKSDSRSIRRYLNGEKKERLRLSLEYFSLTRYTCWIWNVFLSSTELLRVMLLLLSFQPPIEVSQTLEELTTKGIF